MWPLLRVWLFELSVHGCLNEFYSEHSCCCCSSCLVCVSVFCLFVVVAPFVHLFYMVVYVCVVISHPCCIFCVFGVLL